MWIESPWLDKRWLKLLKQYPKCLMSSVHGIQRLLEWGIGNTGYTTICTHLLFFSSAFQCKILLCTKMTLIRTGCGAGQQFINFMLWSMCHNFLTIPGNTKYPIQMFTKPRPVSWETRVVRKCLLGPFVRISSGIVSHPFRLKRDICQNDSILVKFRLNVLCIFLNACMPNCKLIIENMSKKSDKSGDWDLFTSNHWFSLPNTLATRAPRIAESRWKLIGVNKHTIWACVQNLHDLS